MARTQGRISRSAVLVVGLGRFGGALAESLSRMGHDVLGVDGDPAIVQRYAGRLHSVVEADSTNEEAMRQINAGDFDRAVVGIGTGVEASVLTVAVLIDLGVSEIWAKAISKEHGRILERIGAKHVVYPEYSMGERVAHVVSGQMIDYIEFEDGFAIVMTNVPADAIGRTLADTALRTHHGITVVGVKSPGKDFVYARPETIPRRGDRLVVCGQTDLVERFAALT